jgi:hypothetical protein
MTKVKVCLRLASFFGKTAYNSDTLLTTELALATLGLATQIELFVFLVM